MKHTFKKTIAIIGTLAYLLIGSIAHAQVPQKFNYQGIARDAKGNPIGKQQLAIKLSVLPTEDATVAEYEETQMVQTNEFGLYNLQIGNGTKVTGDMKDVKWETGNKYIQVSIDPKGGSDYVLLGTSQLLSVPYAIYADRAGEASVGGSDTKKTRGLNNYIEMTDGGGITDQTSSIYQKPSSVNIGLGANNTTIQPDAKLHVYDGLSSTGVTEVRIQHPNTTNNAARLSFFNDASHSSNTNSTATPTPFSAYSDYAVLNKYSKSKTGAVAPGYANADLFGFNNSIGNLLITTGGQRPNITTGVLTGGLIGFGRFDLNPPSGPGAVKTFMNYTTPLATSRLDVNGSGKATGIHATANQQSVGQTQTAITGAMGITSPYVEAIAIFGEAKATGSFPNGNNVGVAGSAMLSTSPNNNLGVIGEAGNAPGYNTAVAGVIVQGTNPFAENVAISGYAPLTPNSFAGKFVGKVTIKDLSQANNYVLTSDANGTGTWMDPSINPLLTAASANDWHLNGNTVGAINFVGTNNDVPLRFKVFGQDAGHIENNKENAFYGFRAGESNLPLSAPGNRNTGIGDFALRLNTTGQENTALGRNTLAFNVTAKWNTAIGSSALENNVGEANTATGVASMFSNTAGAYNVANGAFTLTNNTTGNVNTAIGENTMQQNTIGNNNTAIGGHSLDQNINGNNNTAVGVYALSKNISGTSNVAVGSGAAFNNLASDNVAVGLDALFTNTTGTRNTAIGINSLNQNTSNDNTAVGFKAMSASVTGIQNTAVGLNSMELANGGSYSTAIGMYSLRKNQGTFNTGLGWKTLQENTTGTQNDAVGAQALGSNTTGNQNVAMGHNALYGNISGTCNTAIGFRAGEISLGTETNATSVGCQAPIETNVVWLGNASVTAVKSTAGVYTTSDARVKKDITTTVPGLSFINKLRPVTYHYSMDAMAKMLGTADSNRNRKAEAQKESILYSGFLAQEVEQAAKDANYDFSGVSKPTSAAGMYGVSYSEFVVPLVKAVQEQQEIIKALEARLKLLEEKK
jgi:trimeric autotransporter adhesin